MRCSRGMSDMHPINKLDVLAGLALMLFLAGVFILAGWPGLTGVAYGAMTIAVLTGFAMLPAVKADERRQIGGF